MYVQVPCPLCRSERRRIRYRATRPEKPVEPSDLACTTAELASYDTVVECLDCGVVYVSPRPEAADIEAAYGRMSDRGFLEEGRARQLTYRRLLRELERLPGAGGRVFRGRRLLDAGCSMGFFLREARDAGWEVEGIEASRWAVEYAREEMGLAVHEGSIASAALEPDSFDVITIWDVVEHLMDPVADFRHLARALKPGGVFGLSTHSIGSLSARLLGRRYPFLQAMHATHFTPRTTARLFAMAGLKQVRVRPHLRTLRIGYLVKKIGQKSPRAAGALGGLVRLLGMGDRHVVVAGVGIFNAYAVKPGSAAERGLKGSRG